MATAPRCIDSARRLALLCVAALALACGSSAPPSPLAPSAPQGVSAVGQIRAATVSWSAPADAGTSDISNYLVSASPGGARVTAAGSATSATVSGLANGGTYLFAVVAINDAGPGPAGSSAAITLADIPGAPTAVAATAGDGALSVSWGAPASNGGSAITGYALSALLASAPDAGAVASATAAAADTSAQLAGLANGTPYLVSVAAVNAAGVGPAAISSAVAPVQPAAPPDAPGNVTAVAEVGAVQLSWSAPATHGAAITGYSATATSAGGSITTSAGPSSTSALVGGLANATHYALTVIAHSAAGDSAASAAASATTPGLPGAPGGLSAQTVSGQFVLSWSAPASDGGAAITGYVVRGGASGDLAASGTSALLTGLGAGTSYALTVAAINAVGTGPDSAPLTVTPCAPPDPPTGVSASPAGTRTLAISWSAPADGGCAISGYKLSGSDGASTFPVATSGTALTAQAGALTNGAAYTFTVIASNSAGDSAPSAPSAPATPSSWIQLGPEGGNYLTVHAGDATRAYATGQRGLYGTTDTGQSWQVLLPYSNDYSASIVAVDPRSPSTLWVSGYQSTTPGGSTYLPFLIRSEDGGASWTTIDISQSFSTVYMISLAVDPTSSSALYAGTSAGVAVSTDSGRSWTAASGFDVASHYINTLSVDPKHPSTIYATDRGDSYDLWISRDSGQSFARSKPWSSASYAPDGIVIGVAVSPLDGAAYETGQYYGVWRSDDQGLSWTQSNGGAFQGTSGNVSNYAEYIAIDPASPSTLYVGATNDGLEQGHLWVSTNDGGTWTQAAGEDHASAIESLSVGASSTDSSTSTLFLSSYAGLQVSRDQGQTLTDRNHGIVEQYISSLAVDSTGVLYAGGFSGLLYRSSDGGETWSPTSARAVDPKGSAGVSALLVDPATDTTVYAGTSEGAFVSLDSGAHWSSIATLPNGSGVPVINFAVDTRASPRAFYVGSDSAGLRRSTDGSTWQTSTPTFTSAAVAVDPFHARVVYLYDRYGGYLQKSTDGGNTFQATGTGLTTSFEQPLYPAVDPSTDGTIYLWGYHGLNVSTDSAATWSQPAGAGLPANPNLSLFAIDPRHPGTLYAAVDTNALYKSTDAGASWRKLSTLGSPRALAFDATDAATLYLGGLSVAKSMTSGE